MADDAADKTPLGQLLGFLAAEQPAGSQLRAAAALLVLVCISLRCALGLHPHSGMGKPPMFGDFEAQRHWMELTTALPLGDWYRDTPQNDLQYWGLDYPPLSAYQSWLCGLALHRLEPAAVALGASRGYESASSKLVLRLSVLAFDVALFFPAAWAAVGTFHPRAAAADKRWALAVLLLHPAALLIDHGHFQYNSLGLGLALLAAARIARGGRGNYALGSVCFVLALNHKQMALYYAPAFFGHLLGRCFGARGAAGKLGLLALLGAAVAGTFAAVWAPYLRPDRALPVLRRLAPLKRGLYEDYVANFWCATHPVFKWKRRFGIPALVRLCAGATALAMLPATVHQVLRPSAKGLLYAMANSAFAFFLFSFQVHENFSSRSPSCCRSCRSPPSRWTSPRPPS